MPADAGCLAAGNSRHAAVNAGRAVVVAGQPPTLSGVHTEWDRKGGRDAVDSTLADRDTYSNHYSTVPFWRVVDTWTKQVAQL
jgi:hypothetical protein